MQIDPDRAHPRPLHITHFTHYPVHVWHTPAPGVPVLTLFTHHVDNKTLKFLFVYIRWVLRYL